MQDGNVLNIAALVETEGDFSWMKDTFEFTISMINDKHDGLYDDILNGTKLSFRIADPQCDDSKALKAYLNISEELNRNFEVVIGPRCSGGAIITGMITTSYLIPHILYSASSVRLSDKSEFPYISRLVPPGDARGSPGAMVAMLRGFGWVRVSIIATNSMHSKDYVSQFNALWDGNEIATSETVDLNKDGTVDEESLRLALKKIPVNDPVRNSRVILLLANSDEAYSILKIANEIGFQDDTIWIGPAAWAGRNPSPGLNFPTSSLPGYIGLTPYNNRGEVYDEFLKHLNKWQEGQQKTVWTEMPDFAAENLVDSILAVAQTFSLIPKYQWKNASRVSRVLRSLSFEGISGRVSFSELGDRENPQYSIVNMQLIEGKYSWVPVGKVGTQIDSHSIESSKICFAVSGCNLSQYPSDKYPVPPRDVDPWVIAVIFSIVSILVVVLYMLRRSYQKKKSLQASMSEIQKKIEAMQKIDEELLSLDDRVEAARIRKSQLFRKREHLQDKPETWSNSGKVLAEVLPDDDQYWKVAKELKLSMSNAHISKLWRVENMSLWTYYSFHKDRLSMNGISHNEKNVWHGTSSTDPAVIYHDRQDGFMMQYSQSGSWG
jgi:ABC-type branched-subunit amino acid transport system substrate-binding protein